MAPSLAILGPAQHRSRRTPIALQLHNVWKFEGASLFPRSGLRTRIDRQGFEAGGWHCWALLEWRPDGTFSEIYDPARPFMITRRSCTAKWVASSTLTAQTRVRTEDLWSELLGNTGSCPRAAPGHDLRLLWPPVPPQIAAGAVGHEDGVDLTCKAYQSTAVHWALQGSIRRLVAFICYPQI